MSSVKFYCMSPMDKAIVHSYGSGVDSAYPFLNAKNFNRNTYAQGSAANGSFSASYDLGSALTIDAMIFNVRNYKVADQPACDRYYSDNGSSFSFVSGSPSMVGTTNPLRISEGLTASGAHRYWAFSFSASTSGSIKSLISVVACAKLLTLPTIHQVDSTEGLPYSGDQSQSKDGGVHFNLTGRRPNKEFSRSYIINSNANLAIMQNVWLNSFGMKYPIVIVEDNGVASAPLMVKFAAPFQWKVIRAQLYQIDCNFIEVPYIESGELY